MLQLQAAAAESAAKEQELVDLRDLLLQVGVVVGGGGGVDAIVVLMVVLVMMMLMLLMMMMMMMMMMLMLMMMTKLLIMIHSIVISFSSPLRNCLHTCVLS